MNCLKEKKTKRKEFLKVIFLIKSNYLICVFASKPINFIRTFALVVTAEYYFSRIALYIAVSKVQNNLLNIFLSLQEMMQLRTYIF